MTPKTGGLGISAKFSAIKDFLQPTVCRSPHLPGHALPRFQLNHRLDEERFPRLLAKHQHCRPRARPFLQPGPTAPLSCSKFPFPTPFLPAHLPPNPSAPFLLCALLNYQPIAPTFPRLLRFAWWCHPSSATLYLQSRYFFSQLFNVLILITKKKKKKKKKITPPIKEKQAWKC